jgi:hypothetical protein
VSLNPASGKGDIMLKKVYIVQGTREFGSCVGDNVTVQDTEEKAIAEIESILNDVKACENMEGDIRITKMETKHRKFLQYAIGDEGNYCFNIEPLDIYVQD